MTQKEQYAVELFEASGFDIARIDSIYPGFGGGFDPTGIDEEEIHALVDVFQRSVEIIEPEDHPSIQVSGGTFARPEESQWHDLHDDAETRQSLEKAIAATGQVRHGLDRIPRGTAWLVRPDLVATARHVAREFVEPDGDGGFRLKPDAQGAPSPVQIDFLDETQGDPAQAVAVTRPIWYEPGDDEHSPDIALLEVEDGHGIPYLELESDLEPYEHQRIVVVGFPAPGYAVVPIDPKLLAKYFSGVFWVKRVAPGTVFGDCEHAIWEFCTNATLEDGSSGSPVVDIATGRVAGLHAAGEHLEQNRAVFGKILQLRIDQLIHDGVLDPI